MVAKDLISDDIAPVKTSDTGLEALNWMVFYKVSHLPIVNNQKLLGLIAEDDIYELNSPEEPIGNHRLSLFRPYVYANQHPYEVLEVASRLRLTVIPVISEEDEYMGMIKMVNLMHYFARLSAIEKSGGIIVLDLHINDYSLSEIAQIVESNDAKILSLYIKSQPDSVRIEVTLKLNVSDLTSIIQTFNRYDYEVKASFMEVDQQEDLYNSRFDHLMRYLNT
ncbi:MAG: CBS domain-containing protein [Bacteroidales bacterium]|nr:CBS domain-containing protein [Bacteroidales bacterium]MBS3773549.1 CBS domain-containing protein [Bacteroidales bacterium]